MWGAGWKEIIQQEESTIRDYNMDTIKKQSVIIRTELFVFFLTSPIPFGGEKAKGAGALFLNSEIFFGVKYTKYRWHNHENPTLKEKSVYEKEIQSFIKLQNHQGKLW